jgi:hypothetical protein
VSRMPRSPGDIQVHRVRIAWRMFVISILLVAAPAILAVLDRSSITASPVLLGYLVADPLSFRFGLITPRLTEWRNLFARLVPSP